MRSQKCLTRCTTGNQPAALCRDRPPLSLAANPSATSSRHPSGRVTPAGRKSHQPEYRGNPARDETRWLGVDLLWHWRRRCQSALSLEVENGHQLVTVFCSGENNRMIARRRFKIATARQRQRSEGLHEVEYMQTVTSQLWKGD